MKKIIISSVVALASLTSSFSQSYSGDTWPQVKAKGEGTISLAYVETFGFVYKDNRKLNGVCVDIMNDFVKYVTEKKNIKLNSQFVGDGESFKGMYDKVKT